MLKRRTCMRPDMNRGAAVCAILLTFAACGSDSSGDTLLVESTNTSSGTSSDGNGSSGPTPDSESTESSESSESTTGDVAPPLVELIKTNQVGYLPVGEKVAIVPDVPATTFDLVAMADGSVVYSGDLSSPLIWSPAGAGSFKRADFTGFEEPGQYAIHVDGAEDSAPFRIDADVFAEVHDATLKAYYFNRASTDLPETYAGPWARAAGHPDTDVLVHGSAATSTRPEGTSIAAARGWYDAGDYGKYTVTAAVASYTLLAAYEHFPEYYADRDLNIPESGNDVPDVLDEVAWSLDWMIAMQDEDGGVYHQLTTDAFPGPEAPAQDLQQRYVIGKTTAATLDFAAVMAVASRVYTPFETAFPGASDRYGTAALAAWDWANANNDIPFVLPSDIDSGEYGDSEFTDEFGWAAAELAITTGDPQYLDIFASQGLGAELPSWQDVGAFAFVSLAATDALAIPEAVRTTARASLVTTADTMERQYRESPYGVPMVTADFYWGSNSVVLNKAFILAQAHRWTGESSYRDATLGALAYIFGRNPTDYSYVTGAGSHPPLHIAHRPSESDDVADPVPGFVVGGPHSGWQDGCIYPFMNPARSYLDDYCSYSTNEVAVNWNAPLAYVLAAVQVE